MWLSVLIDELDRVNIKLQHLRLRAIAIDIETNLCMRRAGTARRQKTGAERERRQ
jgi:hypothetical protein